MLLLHAALTVCAQVIDNQSFEKWSSDKYSMFIHFGLYSHLGGVWDGEPVRQGYSEQIQSFAGIFSDWYAETAYEFDPVNFDADEIAILAKEAGMRSIVFTSKHHDGFCMYDTGTTGYNSMKMLQNGRDFVRELSDACRRHGLRFGLYYSLIDWNFPHAYPISSHNADFVTEEHHEFSKAQVRELLTSYGPVSELWFDMGSLEPWQSKELYDLVKSLQPDCMVSGRLGNDFYDFAVMADNKLPQTTLHAPWQSAASMFSETWSYRSWQERGDPAAKTAEKLRTLIDVVSSGGNYLLNIGPASDGSVVPFEKEVLLSVGRWLERNGDAIYGTDASPYHEDFPWGDVTVKGDRMYLFLTGDCPADGRILLPMNGLRLRSAEGASASVKGRDCVVEVDGSMYSDPVDVKVVTLTFDRMVADMSGGSSLSQDNVLTSINAVPRYSYSCFDYYSNYRSTVSYGWDVAVSKPTDEVELIYTAGEEGREIVLEIDGEEIPILLNASGSLPLKDAPQLTDYCFTRLRWGVFDGPASWDGVDLSSVPSSDAFVSMSVMPFSNYIMTAEMSVPEPGLYLLDVTAGNGMELVVDGRTFTKHLNEYRTECRTEKVLMELSEGTHQIILRAYNRFEETLDCGMKAADSDGLLKMMVKLPFSLKKGVRNISVRAGGNVSEHKDCGLHNLRIRL